MPEYELTDEELMEIAASSRERSTSSLEQGREITRAAQRKLVKWLDEVAATDFYTSETIVTCKVWQKLRRDMGLAEKTQETKA